MKLAHAGLALLLMAAAPAPTPVVIAPAPGTPLDTTARTLMAQDMTDARHGGERPLVLVGSARLDAAATARPALFVQLQSARACGSAGCETSVFVWRSGAWVRVLDGIAGKLAVAATRTRGMADLITETERYVWTGTEYRDATPAPTVDLRPRRRR